MFQTRKTIWISVKKTFKIKKLYISSAPFFVFLLKYDLPISKPLSYSDFYNGNDAVNITQRGLQTKGSVWLMSHYISSDFFLL